MRIRSQRKAGFAAQASRWAERLAPYVQVGTQGYAPNVRRRLMVVNFAAFLIAAFSLFYALLLAVWDLDKYLSLVAANLLLVVLAMLAPLGHRISEICAATVIACAEYAALFYFVRALGHDSGIQINYLVGAAIPFAIFGLAHIGLVVVTVVLGVALHLTTYFLFPPQTALVAADPALLTNLYVTSVATTGILIAAIVLYAFALAERARAEADSLLLNVLPEQIAGRLKQAPRDPIADSIPEASVMFTDLAGFTALSNDLNAEEMLAVLDDIFSRFDRAGAKHGIEKIKTIGDGYMAVCGVVDRRHNHATRLARFALELPREVADVAALHGRELHLRIGMSCGPVMAGIIGTDRFSFDVWGEAVNLASRLETLAPPGQIAVCPAMRKALDHRFAFDAFGTADIKGIGKTKVFLLKGNKRSRARGTN